MRILNRRSASMLSLAVCSTLAAADPAPTSSYYTDPQSSYVEDATSQSIGLVNMITCIMSSMRPDALVNQGPYLALVDDSKCDTERRASTSNSAGGTQAANYMTATVNATRASNTDPMRSRIWIDEENEGQRATIFVNVSATRPPTDANPYGTFRLDYCGRGEGMSSCMMNGYLEGSDSGLRFFENEQGDNGTNTKALQLTASGTASGSGRMQVDTQNGQGLFNFAYNASLFRRSDGNDDQCFSRDASDPDTGFSVWRYGLYDASTGARVTRNSGFPIEFATGGQTHHGYLGYYGLSLPGPAMNALTSGSTIQKVDYSNSEAPTKTAYTVVKSGGKLMKYTRRTRTLQELDKIKFTTFVGNNGSTLFAGATNNTQYELYWDNAGGVFKVSGQMNCGGNGCQISDLPQEYSVAYTFWQSQGGVQGWSQSLGGEVFINLSTVSGSLNSGAVQVIYRSQDLVYPSQLPATLYCLRDCPTSSTLSAYFAPNSAAPSPFVSSTYNNWNPTAAGSVVSYQTDATQALLLDGASQPVVFNDAEALRERPQYQYGVRTGRLFPNLAAAECSVGSGTYCDWKVNEQEVYYQWETGANSHNQFAAVKDSNGQFLTFDAPLHVTFNVPNNAQYGQYAGKSIVLQYGGFGDLWGIPGHCVSRSTNEHVSCEDHQSRYVPAFVIPVDATAGRVSAESTQYLVKWLDREIRFARKDPAVCSAAGLNLPSGITLPTQADLKDPSNASSDVYVGTKPTLTSAPRVIHGDVKF